MADDSIGQICAEAVVASDAATMAVMIAMEQYRRSMTHSTSSQGRDPNLDRRRRFPSSPTHTKARIPDADGQGQGKTKIGLRSTVVSMSDSVSEFDIEQSKHPGTGRNACAITVEHSHLDQVR